jgi:hypothetical protein
MRYRPLSRPYHTIRRDFGFRDMPISALLLQRQTLLSLIELKIFCVACIRVASNRAQHGQFNTSDVYDWEHADAAFNQCFHSELCLENLIHLAKSGGRHRVDWLPVWIVVA